MPTCCSSRAWIALPKVPVSPKLRVALGLALVLALLLGTALAFALDALDRSLKSQEDIAQHLHLDHGVVHHRE